MEEYTQKEIKKMLKCLARDVRSWNPGRDIPASAEEYLKKEEVSLEDFWSMRKEYALAGLNVTPALVEK